MGTAGCAEAIHFLCVCLPHIFCPCLYAFHVTFRFSFVRVVCEQRRVPSVEAQYAQVSREGGTRKGIPYGVAPPTIRQNRVGVFNQLPARKGNVQTRGFTASQSSRPAK